MWCSAVGRRFLLSSVVFSSGTAIPVELCGIQQWNGDSCFVVWCSAVGRRFLLSSVVFSSGTAIPVL